MNEHGHRTFVGTLVFLDVLDPLPEALECVEQATSRAVGHLEAEDVISVAHPRGMVLVFPGDPEDGLFVALGLRDALEHEAANRSGFGARMAVHLGPVRIVDGVAQGEGPTVGAQLASVAAPGGVRDLPSRSFYEVVSSLSSEHRGLLHPLGRKRTARGQGAGRVRARLARRARGGGHLACWRHASTRGARPLPPRSSRFPW